MTSIDKGKAVDEATLVDYNTTNTTLPSSTDDAALVDNNAAHTTLLSNQVKDAGDAVLYIPAHHSGKVDVISRKVRWVIKMAIVITRRGKPLDKNLDTQLLLFLRAMKSVDMNEKLAKATQIRKVFEAIVKEPTHYQLPEVYANMIIGLWEKWENDRWGAEEEEEEEEEGEVADVQTTKSPTTASSSKFYTQADDNDNTIAVRRPPATHPIYGARGIMRGILVMQKKTRVYILDDAFQRRDHKAFGHNGLRVGDWWPMQLAALRDGAHGARMGGIAGSTTDGAYSIVVSGQYSKLDQDFGTTLYYSGSGSSDNTSASPADTRATRCLIRSIETGRPVRVLRSAGGTGAAPSVGIRYDGLYTVGSRKILENDLGGAYLQFKLVRQAGQNAMNYTHPTPNEQRDVEYIKSGY
ncbi:MAG: hypothetical protein M1813_004966 [Trichoglossum hirsutum]|nr:MAG: hypothetical protein M1813_004966 [Trichoglossum hirsutum]